MRHSQGKRGWPICRKLLPSTVFGELLSEKAFKNMADILDEKISADKVILAKQIDVIDEALQRFQTE